MNQTPDTSTTANNITPAGTPVPNPIQCLGGAAVAGGIAFVLYLLTGTIAHYFATKGVHSDNLTVQRLSAAVRTLIIGMSALGAGIFGLSAVGLFGLGIQLLVRGDDRESTPPANS
jgi:hypothetical protein